MLTTDTKMARLRLVRFDGIARADTLPDDLPLQARWSLRGTVAGPNETRHAVLASTLAGLATNMRLDIVHSLRPAAAPAYALELRLRGRHAHPEVAQEVAQSLSIAAPGYWVEPADLRSADASEDASWPVQAVICPAPARLCTRGGSRSTLVQVEAKVPFPAKLPSWVLTAPLEEQLGLTEGVRIELRCSSVELQAEDQSRIYQWLQRLRGGALSVYHPHSPLGVHNASPGLREAVCAHLQRWLTNPRGYAVTALVRAPLSPSRAAVNRMAEDIFHEMPCSIEFEPGSCQPATASFDHMLRCEQGTPALLPAMRVAQALGMPQHFLPPLRKPPEVGLLIGRTACGPASTQVAIPETVRAMHMVLTGSSGSGKSTLMNRMIGEEINDPERHFGIGAIDPHGDLVQEALRSLPAERAADVVLIDVTDPEFSVCLNPLEGFKDNPVRAQYVANQYCDIVDQLFEGADTSGPVTRSHLKYLLLLAGGRPGCQGTLLDAVRALEEPDFRDWLVSKSSSKAVRAYWERLARTSGDAGLTNWVPYLLARLTPIVSNPALKRLFCRPVSTVDLRRAMDDRQIVLVNLSKGVLQDVECRVAGAILMTMFAGAATSRANVPEAQRVPFHLYCDEFASFANAGTPRMFAEARKYKLALTVATQSLGAMNAAAPQSRLVDSILANTGTKCTFRLGAGEAEAMTPYFSPAVSAADMARLPDRHAVISMTGGQRPLPPFVVAIDAPRPPTCPGVADAARAFSSGRHATTIVEANRTLREVYGLEESELC